MQAKMIKCVLQISIILYLCYCCAALKFAFPKAIFFYWQLLTSLNKMWFYLQQAASCLTDLDQSPSASALESMKPFFNAIVKPELLKHEDSDVKLLVAICVCEITRITAPEAPYSDDVLKVSFIYSGYLKK